jgi:phosphoribosylformylglycinamidine cyclo-ligase
MINTIPSGARVSIDGREVGNSPVAASDSAPGEHRVRIDRASWTPPPVFDLVASVGRVPQPDLEATLNQGVGMVALVPPDAVDDALRTLAERDLPAWVCGEAGAAETADGERVLLEGHHPAH